MASIVIWQVLMKLVIAHISLKMGGIFIKIFHPFFFIDFANIMVNYREDFLGKEGIVSGAINE